VRADVPEQLRRADRPDVVLAQAFGPDPLLVDAAAQRLVEAGTTQDHAVVLAVVGSSDPRAQADSAAAARWLGRRLGRPVTLATTAMGGPKVPEAVARLRAGGAHRVAVASWLLAPGLFHRTLYRAGADVVAEPLAEHDAVIELISRRYRAALGGFATSGRSRPA
jgi:sirohydrochlorin ferrochelatase